MGEVISPVSCSKIGLKPKFFRVKTKDDQSVVQRGFLMKVAGSRAEGPELVIEVGGGRIHAASRGIESSKDRENRKQLKYIEHQAVQGC